MLSKKLKSKDAEGEEGSSMAEEKGTTKDETVGKSFKGKRRKMSTSEVSLIFLHLPLPLLPFNL